MGCTAWRQCWGKLEACSACQLHGSNCGLSAHLNWVSCCREHMNVVFIGHVDAGKSTTCGQILLLTVGQRSELVSSL